MNDRTAPDWGRLEEPFYQTILHSIAERGTAAQSLRNRTYPDTLSERISIRLDQLAAPDICFHAHPIRKPFHTFQDVLAVCIRKSSKKR
ncbi:hypothetical protein FGI60_15845 [Brucella haematophila]|nr:hypothetical protein FGI60_15845 [Brucella haematophila]